MTLWIGKLVLLAAASVCLAQLVRSRAPALGVAVSLGICAALTMLLLPQVRELWTGADRLFQSTGLDPTLFLPLIKTLAVVQITHIAAELCRDGGERAVAAQVELCGAVAALLCALPLAKQALELIGAIGS
ncbi:MAG: hypothetical protein II028_01010 [Clostridia bacterium]|jgi:Stage III sporulation protein AC/AD protein family.|nr:hypothetical protein [Clostridia bacterium]